MDASVTKHLRRVRTLGHGASGAVVWLASDDASGQLLAVKSSSGAAGAAQLRREEQVLEGLCSPHIVPCLGSRAAAGGEYQLFLKFAPGGSLADEATRSGGRIAEPAIRAYAGDVARGLAYLHARSLVHGDVKAGNVVIGRDGRARLTDFGCARSVLSSPSSRPIGGTPAFMAPEVARGEEQGPPADVWAVACTVIEMATGRAPWSDVDSVLAALHKIGYTDAVPELPASLSPQAKSFLRMCLARNPRSRPTAEQLLEHPFLVSAAAPCDADHPAKHDGASPNSTLDAAFWESDDEDEDASERAVQRISSLASPCTALPDWESEEACWIQVRSSEGCRLSSAAPAATVTTGAGSTLRSEALDDAAVVDLDALAEGASRLPTCSVGVRDDSVRCQEHSTVSAGGNARIIHDDLAKCQRQYPRARVGNNVGTVDGFVKCQIQPRK
ncbi:hypothetical protein U9M48_017986 [Paspalum notatum var. saurae]|uniref:Protein kinase domain-containing protein n=1 Tax=Paspalum notatum var. saurae TaxID=547442 RepID=A0AAQ3T9P6_PASNO